MPRKLVALNLALAAAATLLIVYIVRQFLAPMPLPVGGRRTAAPAAASAAAETPPTPPGAYGVVAARNLFSPTRTEAPATAIAGSAAPLVKPNLFGVVVRESGSIAYLEDPTTKRVAGYRVGDRILGGTVQTIKADGIVIDGGGVSMDVRLHDPGKPRSQTATAAPTTPTALPVLPGMIPPAPTTPTMPTTAAPFPQVVQPPTQSGVPMGVVPGQPTGVLPGQPGQPAGVMPGPQPITPSLIPGRRPIPPNLLRRLPPGMGDAPRQ
jgi:hypothetical protein